MGAPPLVNKTQVRDVCDRIWSSAVTHLMTNFPLVDMSQLVDVEV